MAGLTPAQIKALADQWLRQALEESELDRSRPLTKPASMQYVIDREDVLDFVEADSREQLARNDNSKIKQQVDIYLRDNPSIPVEEDSHEYWQLSREILKRHIKYCDIEKKRNRGDYTDEVESTLAPAPSFQQVHRPKAQTLTLVEAVEKYIDFKTNGPKPWARSSQKDIPPQVREFAEIVGKDKIIGDLSRDDMRTYWDAMLKLPSRRQSKAYRDKSLKQLLKLNIPQDQRLSPKTLDNRFTNIKTFLNWAELEGCVDRAKPLNAMLMAPKPEADAPKRKSFTHDELVQLFHPDRYGQGKAFSKPWHYWIPLLSLFTGARAEELAQLHTADIREEDGVWILDINRRGDKTTKTKASNRIVPLHPFLIHDLKFLEFVNWSKKRKGPQLFKELKIRESSGNRSGAVSQWFTRYRRACGIGAMKGVSSLTFHSFRHTMITWCKHHDINRPKYKEVVGHEQGETKDVTSGYEGRYPVQTLFRDVIEPLDFHSTIPLTFLKETKWTKW